MLTSPGWRILRHRGLLCGEPASCHSGSGPRSPKLELRTSGAYSGQSYGEDIDADVRYSDYTDN